MEKWTVCRLCLQSNEASMKSLPDVTYEMIPFSNIYYELMGITFTDYPSFPGIICSSCEKKMIQSYRFREQCLETETKLKELMNEATTPTKTEVLLSIQETESSKNDQPDEEADIDREDPRSDTPVKDKDEKSTKKVVKVTQKQMKQLETRTIQCSKCKTLFQGIAKFKEHTCTSPESNQESSDGAMDIGPFIEEPQEPETIRLRKQKVIYKCEKCGRTFLSRNNHMLHMDKHNNVKRYPCKHCDERFSCWLQRRNHIFDVHFKKKYCECPHCGQGFNTTNKMRHHIRLQHEKRKIHQCEKCGKIFADLSNLKSHHLTHEGKMKCEICGKVLKHHVSLIDHQKMHGKIEIQKCQVCGRKVKGEVSLKYHMNKVHPEMQNLTSSEDTVGEKSSENV